MRDMTMITAVRGARGIGGDLPLILLFSLAGLLVTALVAAVAPGWARVLDAWV